MASPAATAATAAPTATAALGRAVPRVLWLPLAAWAVFVPLGAGAAALAGGAYVTALVAVVPFGLAGLLLRRARIAVALTLVLGLAVLVLFADPLGALGLKQGTLAGAAVFGALALPLGSGIMHHRRARAAKPAPGAAGATTEAPSKPPAKEPAPKGSALGQGGGTARGEAAPATLTRRSN